MNVSLYGPYEIQLYSQHSKEVPITKKFLAENKFLVDDKNPKFGYQKCVCGRGALISFFVWLRRSYASTASQK